MDTDGHGLTKGFSRKKYREKRCGGGGYPKPAGQIGKGEDWECVNLFARVHPLSSGPRGLTLALNCCKSNSERGIW